MCPANPHAPQGMTNAFLAAPQTAGPLVLVSVGVFENIAGQSRHVNPGRRLVVGFLGFGIFKPTCHAGHTHTKPRRYLGNCKAFLLTDR